MIDYVFLQHALYIASVNNHVGGQSNSKVKSMSEHAVDLDLCGRKDGLRLEDVWCHVPTCGNLFFCISAVL